MTKPVFEPGSGWYRMGPWAPGSFADVAAMKEAAYRCVVFRMRRLGVKLSPDEVALQEPVCGGVICSDQFTYPSWMASLKDYPGMSRQLLRMHEVRLVRQRGGFRQYQGREWNERATESWPQTWFCAPNAKAGIEVLLKMGGAAGPV